MFFELLIEEVAQSCYIKKGVLRNFAKFAGKHLSLLFNKVFRSEVCNFI